MANKKLTDSQAKDILRGWPSSPNSIWETPEGAGRWMRGQPSSGSAKAPRLSSPGAKLFTTQPDGLFACFQKRESCDVVAIEVCGSAQNLNDKRSRYIPATHSLVLRCTAKWFGEETRVQGGGRRKRYQIALIEQPEEDVSVPVRHLRVLYALPNILYAAWRDEHTPTGYEFFCPHSSLGSYKSPKMQDFLKRMSVASQFYLKQ